VQAPVHLSLEEVALPGGHKVLMEVGNNVSLIVGNLRGLLDEQLRPHLINLLNTINILITLNAITLI
jgi:hypothetical protein